MKYAILEKILNSAENMTVTVVGDYCLDKYLIIDSALDEASVETGLTAEQVVRKETYAGAAGTVCANLRGLSAKVFAVGVVGEDGEGYELLRALRGIGVNTDYMTCDKNRCTATYTKPMRDGLEKGRLDFVNTVAVGAETEAEIINNLKTCAEKSDAVILLDQYVRREYGVVGEKLTAYFNKLAATYPNKVFYADSRARISEYISVTKCNEKEILQVTGKTEITDENVCEAGKRLNGQTERAVFVTLGERGTAVFDGGVEYVQAVKCGDVLDICGAGDSASAGIVAALVAGATPTEAAEVGNLAASVTVRQKGRTGVISVREIEKSYYEFMKQKGQEVL